MATKSISKEVRGYLLSLAEEINNDLKNLDISVTHSDEYKATKEIVTTLRKAAGDYRYKKLVKGK